MIQLFVTNHSFFQFLTNKQTNKMTDFDTGNDYYEILIDNRSTEDGLSENVKSSAGNFTFLVQPQLDLSTLLYMRSTDAELCLSKLQIDSLPLSTTRLESCQIQLEIDIESGLVNSNRFFNKTKVDEMNKENMVISLEDNICETPQELVNYVNSIFYRNINHFLLLKYSNIFFDADIMQSATANNFIQPNDAKLLNRYLDLTLYTRHKIHKELCILLRIGDVLKSDYLLSSNEDKIDKKTEENILAKSSCLKIVDERKKLTVSRTVQFDKFYEKDLTDPKQTDPIDVEIKKNVALWIKSMGIRIDVAITRDTDKADIQDLIDSNKKLIDVGLRIRSLLSLEMDRQEGRIRHSSNLFQKDIVNCGLDLSKTRCTFSIFPKQFLCENSKITLIFPPLLSYSMGAEIGKNVQIGPISTKMPFTQQPRLSNTILSPNQRLAHGVRHVPKMMHVVSSIAGSKGRDSWLSQTPFKDYQILFTYLIDEASVNTRGVTSCYGNELFYKVKQSSRILETLKFAILNENFQECHFPQKTYSRIALKIRPIS